MNSDGKFERVSEREREREREIYIDREREREKGRSVTGTCHLS